MKKQGLLLAALLSLPLGLLAQDGLDQIIKGSVKDANYLVAGYMSPLLKSMATGANQGWYNTAKPHKFPGFDLTGTLSFYRLPSKELLYEVDNTKLTNIQLSNYNGAAIPANGKANVPTVFGPDKSPTYTDKLTGTQTFNGPNGLDLKGTVGLSTLPVPLLNLGIGLPKNTELKVRYIPTITFTGLGKMSLIGFGVLHDVKQYIPGIKNLPFDLSGFVGYTRFMIESQLTFPDQKASLEVTGVTVQGLISKKISVLTVYGGLGYNNGKANVDVKGTYDLDGNTANGRETKDPFKLSEVASGVRASAGLRLKLAVFTFHGDYTLQKYSTITAGFGISVR